jgi:hypothetical protein
MVKTFKKLFLKLGTLKKRFIAVNFFGEGNGMVT